jgi:type II secretion system protein L
MNTVLVFAGYSPLRWWRVEDGAITERGEGAPEPGDVVAVLPSASCAWRQFEFSSLSPAQALVAARLDAADNSLGDADDRHVAVTRDRAGYLVTSAGALRTLLAELAEAGLKPVLALPAPALLPVDEGGFVRARFPSETALRASFAGCEDDGVLSSVVVGSAPVRTLGADELDRAVTDALAAPFVTLLQGDFAPRTSWGAEAGYWRRMAVYGVLALALTLTIPVAKWAKLIASTAALEAESAEIAARALGEAEASPESIVRLRARLVDRRGGGVGYPATEGAFLRAMEGLPNTDLGALAFSDDGTLRATVRGTSQADLDQLRAVLVAGGFDVSVGAATDVQGRRQAEFVVRPL